MKITYDVSVDDIAEYSTILKYKSTQHLAFVFIGFFLTWGKVLGKLVINDYTIPLTIQFVLWLIGALYFTAEAVFSNIEYSPIHKWIIKYMAAKKNLGDMVGYKEIELKAEGLFIKTKFSEGLVAWKGIQGIAETKKYFAIKLDDLKFLLIPKKYLRNPQGERFVEELKNGISKNAIERPVQ